MINVHVVDSREVVRRGLGDAIAETTDLTLAGTSSGPDQARRELGSPRPDVVVVEFDDPMTQSAVLELCTELGDSAPAVLVSLRSPDRDRVGEAMLAGASGHVVLTDPLAEILDRIRESHSAPPALGADLAGDLFDRVRSGRAPRRPPIAELTEREQEVMALLADGLDNRRIAESLHLSPKTVKNHVSAILKKLGMASRTEAAVFAAREAARDVSAF